MHNNNKVKGCCGYLDAKKKNQLTIAVLSLVMVAVICVTGIIMYHTQKSVFAVMAALAALPAAKMLVGYLVIMPYHSDDENIKHDIEEICGNTDCCTVLYDVVLSSADKSMSAGTVFIKNGKIYGYTEHYKQLKEKKGSGKAKTTLADIEKHIKFIVDANCNYSAIKLFDDRQKYLNAIAQESNTENGMTADGIEKMKNMNERIAAQLKIYMF